MRAALTDNDGGISGIKVLVRMFGAVVVAVK